MTRSEFMHELAGRLGRLSEEERNAALSYYEEYFDEAGPDREAEVIRELGNPAQVASRILADHAVKAAREAPMNAGKGLSALWFILLAVFAAPLALPVIFAIIGIVVGLGAVVIAIGVAAVALFIGGIALFVGGFVGLFSAPATALVLFGAAFVLWGLGKIVFAIVGAAISFLSGVFGWLFDRSGGNFHGR